MKAANSLDGILSRDQEPEDALTCGHSSNILTAEDLIPEGRVDSCSNWVCQVSVTGHFQGDKKRIAEDSPMMTSDEICCPSSKVTVPLSVSISETFVS